MKTTCFFSSRAGVFCTAAGLLCFFAYSGIADENLPTVSADVVQTIKTSVEKTYIGNIVARNEVHLVPRVTGVIQKVHFKDGAPVKKGDLLIEIEDTTYRARVKSCEAQLAQAVAQQDYSRKEYERNKTLQAKDAVAVANFDNADRAYKEAIARVMAAEAALIDARNDFSYTRIYAPLTGRIGKIAETEGNLVTPATGSLCSVVEQTPIHVRFALSERIFSGDFGGVENIADRAQIRIKLADGSLYPEIGKIETIDNKINARTNTIQLWASFPNKDGKLIPGGLATVLLAKKNPGNICAIPLESAVTDDNGIYVYILDSRNVAEKRRVKLGNTAKTYQEVLSGVKPGERIVRLGTHKVIPGKPVSVK